MAEYRASIYRHPGGRWLETQEFDERPLPDELRAQARLAGYGCIEVCVSRFSGGQWFYLYSWLQGDPADRRVELVLRG